MTQRLAQVAGFLSRNADFMAFAAIVSERAGVPYTDAAGFIRTTCEVGSRRDLDTNPEAARRFHTIRRTFVEWRDQRQQQQRRAA